MMIDAMSESKSAAKRLGSMKDVGQRCGFSERQGWKLLASGRLIRPIRLGRSVKFDLQELDRWIDVGCPAMDKWDAMRPKAVPA